MSVRSSQASPCFVCALWLPVSLKLLEKFDCFARKCQKILEGRQRREWFINEETDDQFQLITGDLRSI